MQRQERLIQIGEMSVPYRLQESKQARHISLIIDGAGLRVVKPTAAALTEVERVLAAKSQWISKHYCNYLQLQAALKPGDWNPEQGLVWQGTSYPLTISAAKSKSTVITFDGLAFRAVLIENVDATTRRALLAAAIEKWYRQAAAGHIRARLDHYCSIMGVTYNTLRIKEQKTRWGSCSKLGNVNFNWRLMLAPEWVIDYVIVHELCHLRVLNHSHQFWRLVARYMPDYAQAREWLKTNGARLMTAF
ncbi:MAG TPA: SprT family zinc-dependent metalloprotease [Bacillota bacterium]|nr:SprT family zinc-dependent metalloprotease [Bacillota bacterium]